MNDISEQVRALRIDRSRRPPNMQPEAGKTWGRRLVIVLGVALAAATVVMVGKLLTRAQEQITAPSVRIAIARLASATASAVEVTASGYIAAERAARVLPKQTGRVAVVFVKQGQVVSVGDKLVKLESTESQAELAVRRVRAFAAAARAEQARTDVVAAQLACDASQLQATRERQLALSGLSGQAAAEDLEAQVRSLNAKVLSARSAAKVADAETQTARAEVLAAEQSVEESVLVAPIDGTIVNRPPEVGDIIGPSTATLGADVRAIEIASLDSLLIEVDVPEQRIAQVTPEQAVEVLLDCCPTERFPGRVREVTPFLDRAKATVTVKVAFDQRPALLLPNMAGRVYFLAKREDSAVAQVSGVVVPLSALVTDAGRKYVYVLEDSQVRLREVSMHHTDGTEAVLRGGIASGAQVVDSPSKELRDGQTVTRAEN